jgi:hypothetical protein
MDIFLEKGAINESTYKRNETHVGRERDR